MKMTKEKEYYSELSSDFKRLIDAMANIYYGGNSPREKCFELFELINCSMLILENRHREFLINLVTPEIRGFLDDTQITKDLIEFLKEFLKDGPKKLNVIYKGFIEQYNHKGFTARQYQYRLFIIRRRKLISYERKVGYSWIGGQDG